MTKKKQENIRKQASQTAENMKEAGYGSLVRKKDSDTIVSLKNHIISRKPTKIDFRKIVRDSNIRRSVVKDREFDLLKESIQRHGVLQSIVVEFEQIDHEKFKLICVAGHRRLEALHDLYSEKLLETIKDELTEKILFNPLMVPVQLISKNENDRNTISEIALSENVLRKDLHFIEVADACKLIMEKDGLTKEQLAERFEKSKRSIERMLKIADLPEDAKSLILSNSKILTLKFINDNVVDKGRKGSDALRILNLKIASENRKHPKDLPSEENRATKRFQNREKSLIKFLSQKKVNDKEVVSLIRETLVHFKVLPPEEETPRKR